MTKHQPMPIFAVPQSDGTTVTVDFTTTDPFGDFAMGVELPDRTTRDFGVYHNQEPLLFVTILQHWARSAPPEAILEDIGTVRAELHTMTIEHAPSAESENDFDWQLRDIRALAVLDVLPRPADFSDEMNNKLTLSPRPEGLLVTSELGGGRPLSFHVPTDALTIFPVGMIWRTYEEPGGSLPRTRLNTVTYMEALDAFEVAIHHRVGHG